MIIPFTTIKHDLKILSKWFRINSLHANPGKFQFMILGKKRRNSVKLIINTTEIEESKKEVLLGITIDNLLIFNEHIFKQSKSRVYVTILCFQKYNVQYKKRSFAEITCCKIDFLRHKFSVIQSMSTLERLASIY